MQEQELIQNILDLQAPWQIFDISINKDEAKVDIHVGYRGVEKKSIFSFVRKKGGADDGRMTCPHCYSALPDNDRATTIAVRHLPIAGFSTRLHIPSSGVAGSLAANCVCNRQWRKPGTDCTPEFFNEAERLLKLLGDKEQVLSILKLASVELEQILEFVDLPEKKVEEDAEFSASSADDKKIPGINHPNWRKLVKKELHFETKMIALSMLLRRIQTGVEKNPSADAEMTGVKTLRQFFLRNAKLLKDEIEQLRGEAAHAAVAAPEKSLTDEAGIPGIAHPVWQQIIDNKIKLDTNNFAFRMLLGRIMTLVKKNPGAASMSVGTSNLRDFFVANEAKLKKEIAQLREYV